MEPLIATLVDKDLSARCLAAEALGRLGDTRAVEPLIVMIDREASLGEHYYGTRAAFNALQYMEDRGVFEALIGILKSGNASTESRAEAARVLGARGDVRAVDPLIAALDSGIVPHHAIEALGKLRDPRALEPLIGALRYARSAAASALADLGDVRAVEPLIEALGDEEGRGDVALALGELGDPRAVEPLIGLLQDSSSQGDLEAAMALGQLGDARAVQPLVAASWNPEDYKRDAVARALLQVEGAHSLETLISALRDGDNETRLYAAEALGALGDTRAVVPLLAALRDQGFPRWHIQEAATNALGVLSELGALETHPLLTTLPYRGRQLSFLLDRNLPFGPGLMSLIFHATRGSTQEIKLRVLGKIWRWTGQRAAVDAGQLEAALAVLQAQEGLSKETVDANPYLLLFIAQSHKENGRYALALDWAERALARAPDYEFALRIVAGWIRAESLRKLGRYSEALAVLEKVEQNLLGRLSQNMYLSTGVAFDAWTRALKGIVLGELGQPRKSMEALYTANDAVARVLYHGLTDETAAVLLKAIINGRLARVLNEESKVRADRSLTQLEQIPEKTKSRLVQEEELETLALRLKLAIGDGDDVQAHTLAERLALKQQQAPADIFAANPDRQAAYGQLQRRQWELARLQADIDRLKRPESAPESKQDYR